MEVPGQLFVNFLWRSEKKRKERVNKQTPMFSPKVLMMSFVILRPLHTMVEGREAVVFHQSDYKKPRV